ncbi:MAG TPA: MDR family MFS transporter [Nocardioidaceae bacterium]|nr:MDR family MFS transporter [Nocardioidaceae bacterium]
MTIERTRSDVGLRSERGPVLGAVMLCTALVAIDATILAAAVPAIVSDLGGFSQFPWLFSIYLLAQAVSVPIYGKLADAVGRKPVMVVGISLFLVGSVLCGAAWTMPLLIGARAVQGLGAGAILPMSMTIVGDIYTVEERARVQGFIASVWGMASIVGPTLGGVFSEYLSWRWIFFVNLPVGALAAWMLTRHFHEHIERRRHRIDYAGASLLGVGCTLLILALLQGGHSWDWGSAVSITLLVTSAAMLVAVPFVERRAAEPILPLWVFSRRVLVGANAASLLVGAILIGLTSYVPTFAQGVLGFGALLAGFALAAMTIGWPIAAATAGRIYMRLGFRDTSLIGVAFIVLGALLMLTVGESSSLWMIALFTFVVGIGLGYTASPTLVAVQSVVGWDRRGVVTGTNMFARSVGSAVGVAVFGAIANASLGRQFANPPSGIDGHLPTTADDAALVLDPNSGAAPAVREFVRSALAAATHHVFVGVAVLAVVMVAAVLLMPRRSEQLQFD